MKILYITHIWNEINYLPLKVKWCKINGLDIYVLDNFSSDGSWEWLLKNKIPCERINTGGTFHLGILQKATDMVIRKIKPNWVIYVGMDTFVQTDGKLCDEIQKTDKQGFNIISMIWGNMLNIGESRRKFDPFNTYFYYAVIRLRIALIWKYNPKVRLFADSVIFPPKSRRTKELPGIMLNYGNTKPANQRRLTLYRRKLAWNKGLLKGWGTHYLTWAKINWVWDKNKIPDIRKSQYWKYILKLQKIK